MALLSPIEDERQQLQDGQITSGPISDTDSDTDTLERIKKLEILHDIRPGHRQVFIDAVNLANLPADEEGYTTVTDIFAGAGYAGNAIIEQALYIGRKIKVNFIDMNTEMLTAAVEDAKKLDGAHEAIANGTLIINTIQTDLSVYGSEKNIPNSHAILAKMALHEIPEYNQKYLMQKIKRILNPEGKLIIWESFSPNTDSLHTRPINFNKIVAAKDTIVGKHRMADQRHFSTFDEFTGMLLKSGYAVHRNYEWKRGWSTITRCIHEFGGNTEMLANLNAIVAEELKEAEADYTEVQQGNYAGYMFQIDNGIFTAQVGPLLQDGNGSSGR